MTKGHSEAVKKYDAENSRLYGVKLNRATDAKIIDRLEEIKDSGGSMQGYIKDALNEKIAREEKQ